MVIDFPLLSIPVFPPIPLFIMMSVLVVPVVVLFEHLSVPILLEITTVLPLQLCSTAGGIRALLIKISEVVLVAIQNVRMTFECGPNLMLE